jgi:hypothetical protein
MPDYYDRWDEIYKQTAESMYLFFGSYLCPEIRELIIYTPSLRGPRFLRAGAEAISSDVQRCCRLLLLLCCIRFIQLLLNLLLHFK